MHATVSGWINNLSAPIGTCTHIKTLKVGESALQVGKTAIVMPTWEVTAVGHACSTAVHVAHAIHTAFGIEPMIVDCWILCMALYDL